MRDRFDDAGKPSLMIKRSLSLLSSIDACGRRGFREDALAPLYLLDDLTSRGVSQCSMHWDCMLTCPEEVNVCLCGSKLSPSRDLCVIVAAGAAGVEVEVDTVVTAIVFKRVFFLFLVLC